VNDFVRGSGATDCFRTEAMNGFRMAELLAIMCVCALGIFAAEAFIFAHETSHERRARRSVERLINRKYPPTF